MAIEDVDLASIVLRSVNSGSIDEIHAVATKNAVGGDQNRNFVEEITTCFAKEDLRLLFSKVTATNGVTVTLEGHLMNGAQFCVTENVNVRAARGGGNGVPGCARGAGRRPCRQLRPRQPMRRRILVLGAATAARPGAKYVRAAPSPAASTFIVTVPDS